MKVVKMVVDAGAMRTKPDSSLLADFLSASMSNYTVVTDFLYRECVKGTGDWNAKQSFRVLSELPDQVLVLKDTRTISRLDPRMTGVHRRMVDDRQTREFGKYCAAFYRSVPGIGEDLERKQALVNEYFESI
jgi:hypothetical protein